jgi:RNA polymerase sigma-70 factor (family 1)
MYPKTYEYEKQLVSLLKDNNVKAFDILFYKYSKNIYNYSFSILKDSDESKEIVQEVFCRVWNYRSKLDTEKSFKSLLFTITYRLIINHLRIKIKEKKYLNHVLDNYNPENNSLNNNHEYSILSNQIENAVDELPEKRKKIFKLSRENCLSYIEIANELGITTKTVENQINLSLKYLRVRLDLNVSQYY